MQCPKPLSLPTPSQPFHARGRFELVAGCMRRKGRGLVKRQQATEKHNPTKSGLTSIKMQFQFKKKNAFTIYACVNQWVQRKVNRDLVVIFSLRSKDCTI